MVNNEHAARRLVDEVIGDGAVTAFLTTPSPVPSYAPLTLYLRQLLLPIPSREPPPIIDDDTDLVVYVASHAHNDRQGFIVYWGTQDPRYDIDVLYEHAWH